MTRIATPAGEIVLTEPTQALIEAFYHLLPFGLMQARVPVEGALFGLVMKQGEQEVVFTKLQPPDCDAKAGSTWQLTNSGLVAAALAGTPDLAPDGLVLPIVYLRTRTEDRCESGIAVFTAPKEEGRAAPLDPRALSFVKALGTAAKKTAIPLNTIIGVEARPRLALGSIAFSFALVGGKLVCLRRTINEEDPVWALIASLGVRALPHMPALPMEK